MMTSVVYIGCLQELKGQGAILMEDAAGKTWVQFNDTTLRHPVTNSQLGFNWHSFPKGDFRAV